ncbi:MAG: GAF domain-containing protein [Myxococcota bacterium]
MRQIPSMDPSSPTGPSSDATAPPAATIEALRRELERLRAITAEPRDGVLEAILAHSPHGIMVCDATGRITLQSAAAERIWAGSATTAGVEGWGAYRGFHEDGRPFNPGDWGMAICLATRRPVEAREVHIKRFDDSDGWLIASSAPLTGRGGEPLGAMTVFVDITHAKTAEREATRLRSEVDAERANMRALARRASRLQDLTRALGRALSSADVAAIVAAHGRELFGATASLVYFRKDRELQVAAVGGVAEERAQSWRAMSLDADDPLPEAVREGRPVWLASRAEVIARYPHLAPVALNGQALEAVIALPLSDDSEVVGGLAFSFYGPLALDDVQRDFYLMVAEQTAQAIRRARLFEAERSARSAIQRRQERTGIVARAATTLASMSLDSRRALVELTRVVVPDLADWCAIDELRPDGEVRRIAVWHRDPAMLTLAASLQKRYPDNPEQRSGVYEVLRTGQPEWVPEITDAMLVQGARDPDHLALIRELRLTSYAVVPLLARGRVVGALTLVGEGPRRIVADDVAAADEIGRHAALALENARLFEAVEHERARMSALVAATATVVWSARGDGQVTEVSPSWLAFTGQSEAEYLGGGYVAAIHPDDRDDALARWRDAVAAHGAYAAEYRLRRADGSWADTMARAMPLSDGAGGGFVGCNVDITDPRKAEREARDHAETLATLNELGRVLSAELDQLKLAQAVTDAATAVSDAELGAFVYQAIDERGASRLLRTVAGERADRLADLPLPRTADELASTFAGRAVVRADAPDGERSGAPRLASTLAVPMLSRSGELIGGIFLAHTAPGGSTRAPRRWRRARGAGRRHHRQRAPLRQRPAPHQGARAEQPRPRRLRARHLPRPEGAAARHRQHLGLIEDDLGPAMSDEMQTLEFLRSRVARMEALITGILDYSRVGRTVSQREDIDVTALVIETVELITLPPGARVEIDPGLGVLHVEKALLQQVFLNLVGNALKHARRADARVHISGREAPHHWEFAVRDNGPGIAPQFHARVWGLFQTLEVRDKVEGAGIGLATVKKIVETHGGTVRIESDGVSGSTFYFTWPKPPVLS